ncbi:MAG: type II toxin-antitoxin system HicB family antitoxin [Chloroflexi bacterium]|jgi:predicted RNase H-like HicB family nuclease|nr:type II toxin-antitoxin system HicB family antitoxin [Chloroflexota bacterium]
MISYTVVLEYNEGYYTVTVPALPGCITQGRTKEEALEHAKEAIQGYLESMRKDGLAIPEDVELAEVAV